MLLREHRQPLPVPLELIGYEKPACGWAVHLPYWLGFRVGLSRAWVVFEPPPPPATERVGPGILT